jgi:hypothetical protein
LGTVVGAFKSRVAVRWLRFTTTAPDLPAKLWQRGYYERVIRDDAELRRVREYIENNPLQWRLDRENPSRDAYDAYDREWGWIEGSLERYP